MPPHIALPGIAAVGAVLLPVTYLVIRAFSADAATLAEIVFRVRNVVLLGNTLLLVASVLALTTALAVPLAWLAARSDLPGRRHLALLGAMPLAVPGYVAATAYLASAGDKGLVQALTGVTIPGPSGFWGATAVLALFQYPYLFLTLRAAMLGLDASLEESARSLGEGPWRVFWRVTAPQLRPA
ncbi:MAG: iron ABC transporter permease, partial [Armatimonadetes bacterium]|nr:iron ABC transporter permease [Armatimonadota bacterium]